MQCAFQTCETYVKGCLRKTLHMKNFTKTTLGWDKVNDFPEASCKASDSILIMAFLENYLSRPWARHPVIVCMLQTVSAINSCYRFLYGRLHSDGWCLEQDFCHHAYCLLKTFTVGSLAIVVLCVIIAKLRMCCMYCLCACVCCMFV